MTRPASTSPSTSSGVTVERVAVATAAHEADVLDVPLVELDVAPGLLHALLAAQRVEPVGQLVDVAFPEGRVADVAAGIAAEQAEAHRRARALAEEDEPHRPARPVRVKAYSWQTPPRYLPGPPESGTARR